VTNLSLSFETERELFLSYMPFLQNGGLFIRSNELYELGHEINLSVTLPDALEPIESKVSVCWQTPPGVQNGTPAGVGVAFIEDKENLKNQIESTLGHLLSSPEPTLTM
jgi:type IV pilus assembly protein PilZ